MKVKIAVTFLLFAFFSCSPDSYTYHSSTQRISHPINTKDSIYVIYPYVNFSLLGQNDKVLDQDSVWAKFVAEVSNQYLVRTFKQKFKISHLTVRNSELDSIGNQFKKMNDDCFKRRKRTYTLKMKSSRDGYGLIFQSDWLMWDFLYWQNNLRHYGRGAHRSQPRLNVLNYFCLVDLRNGNVVDYKYFYQGFFIDTFHPPHYPVLITSNSAEARSFSSKENGSIDQREIRKIIAQNLDQVANHLLK